MQISYKIIRKQLNSYTLRLVKLNANCVHNEHGSTALVGKRIYVYKN